MDLRLPLLADANFHLGSAEEASDAGSWVTARRELEKAEAALEELRQLWPDLAESERGLLAAMASPLKERAAKISKTLPQAKAVTQGEAVADPEQELEPSE